MRITTTRVANGRVAVDAETLSEGQLVKVVILEEEPVILSDEEKAWLRGALASARDGESTDALAFLEELERVE